MRKFIEYISVTQYEKKKFTSENFTILHGIVLILKPFILWFLPDTRIRVRIILLLYRVTYMCTYYSIII